MEKPVLLTIMHRRCINDSYVFSLLADETTDISGKEQLSIGIRYLKR